MSSPVNPSMPQSTLQTVDLAKLAGPAFHAIFRQAPPLTVHDGREYHRDNMVTVEQKVFYLAAAGLKNPRAVASLAPVSLDLDPAFYLDADPTEVNSARAAVLDARVKLRAAEGKLAALRVRQTQEKANVNRLDKEHEEAMQVGAGDVALGIVTGGISASYRAANLGNLKIQLDQARLAYADVNRQVGAAQGEVESAGQVVKGAEENLRSAQSAYDSENRRIRDREEREREEKLRAEREIADREQRQADADAARRREAQQRYESEQRRSTAEQYVSDPYGEPDYVAEDFPEGGDFYLEGGSGINADYLLDASDVLGDDAEGAEEVAATERENARMHGSSPWGFQMYYADIPPILGVDYTDQDEVQLFDADAARVFAIDYAKAAAVAVSAILALAPVIVNELQPPAEGQAPGDRLKSTVDPYLKTHGEAAGRAAGDQMMVPLLAFAAVVALSL